jgi:O-antigen ligase
MRLIDDIAARARRDSAPGHVNHFYPLAYVIFLCALLMFAVLTFGAIETWSTSILEIGAALLFAGMILHRVYICGAHLRWNPLYPPMLGFGAVLAVQLTLNLTAYRYVTLVLCIQYLAYGMLLVTANQVVAEERSGKLLVLAFSIFGSAVALFAICQNLNSALRMPWLHPPGTEGLIFGTYMNHDHYAGLMEMLAPLALVLSLSKLVHGGQRILAASGAVIMAGSLVLSLSRGGAISLFVELALLFWMTSTVQKGALARSRMLFLVAAILAFIAFIGSPAMWRGLGHLHDVVRLDIWKDSLRIFARKPIFGWGLGTFQNVYPAFRSFYTVFFINAAHNDYVQVLVETGLVGFGCVVWFIVLVYRNGLRFSRNGDREWLGVLRTASLVGCSGILVHSLLDFNLQVPANAALFYVFCALAAGLPAKSGELDILPRPDLQAGVLRLDIVDD